jgi:uncharacterized protein
MKRCVDSKTMSRAALAALIAATVSGCGHSPPTHYFTLNAVPADAPLSTAPLPPVQLTAVHIPAELDRPEVVMQASPNRLAIGENDRWGASLGQMMRRTLAQDLMARLPAGSFCFPDAPAPAGARTLVVTVLDAEGREGGSLTMQTSWTLMAGHPAHVVMTKQATLDQKLEGNDAAALAAAMSAMLGKLADQIATSVSADEPAH